MLIVSPAELYGGKICAALDRQHPRDLFDIQGLLASAKQDSNLIDGFLAMLLGHNRPLHVSLNPDFPSLGIPNLDRMPAIRWKLQNLEKLKKSNPGKFNEQYKKLEQLFS